MKINANLAKKTAFNALEQIHVISAFLDTLCRMIFVLLALNTVLPAQKISNVLHAKMVLLLYILSAFLAHLIAFFALNSECVSNATRNIS